MFCTQEFYVNIVEYLPINHSFNEGLKLYCPIMQRYRDYKKCDGHFKRRLALLLRSDAFDPDINHSSYHWFIGGSLVFMIKNCNLIKLSLPNPESKWDEIIRKYQIQNGDTIYFENSIWHKHNQYDKHDFINQLEKLAKTMIPNINIKYNKLDSPIIYDQIITVDQRILLSKLRGIICDKLNINPSCCTITNIYNDNQTLIQYKIENDFKLRIENKQRLLSNQCLLDIYVENEIKQRCLIWGYTAKIFNIHKNYIVPDVVLNLLFDFYYIKDEELPLIFIGNIIIEKQWRMKQIKQEISDKFYPKVPMAKYMRIRNFMNINTLRWIYFDDKTFEQNTRGSLRDNMSICWQRKQDILLKLIQCNVQSKSFGNE